MTWDTSERAFYIWVACLVGIDAYLLILGLRRQKQIRQYAKDSGFKHSGKTLPEGFPFGQFSIASGRRHVNNVIVGEKCGKQLVIFDYKVGSGRGQRSLTLIAVRSSDAFLWTQRFDKSVKAETIGNWTLVYGRGLWSAKRIQSILETV